MDKKQGFTLIELSIVLVIIGLIVGGVLVGRDLIHAAEQRATLTQIEKLNAAVNTFQIKYNCLPADCSTASNFGFTAIGTGPTYGPNGNGNGLIDNFEQYYFIAMLQQAGLVVASAIAYQGLPIVSPTVNSIGSDGMAGAWWLQNMSSLTNASTPVGHYFWGTTAEGVFGVNGTGIFSTADAYYMDNKIDDGLPRSGTVLANGAAVSYDFTNNVAVPTFVASDATAAASSSNTQCVTNASPHTYNLLNNSPALCSIAIRAAF